MAVPSASMESLPQPPTSFVQKKSKILTQLAVPEVDYTDASPKGSIDAGIRDLIDGINDKYDGLVTTSSCGGRVSVFLEGRKCTQTQHEDAAHEHISPSDGKPSTLSMSGRASQGGKGGGEWLFVSHDPVDADGKDWATVFGMQSSEQAVAYEPSCSRLIHFKFEPMVSS